MVVASVIPLSSGPLRNIEPALHGRASERPLEPGRNELQPGIFDELAGP
jgi:hypothetical protein